MEVHPAKFHPFFSSVLAQPSCAVPDILVILSYSSFQHPTQPTLPPSTQTDALEFIQGKSSILEASAAGILHNSCRALSCSRYTQFRDAGDIQLVQAHITAGSDVNHRGSDGATRIDLSFSFLSLQLQHLHIFASLSHPTPSSHPSLTFMAVAAGQTPLHEACWSSHPHIVRLLLNSGIFPFVTHTPFSQPSFHSRYCHARLHECLPPFTQLECRG
jgi:hypothetical protein